MAIPPALCKLLNGVRSSFNDPACSDVTLVVENRKIFAHRLVLCSRSKYFEKCLTGDFAESAQREVPFKDIRYDVMVAILEDLYFRADIADSIMQATDVHLFLEDTLCLAEFLLLDDIVSKCKHVALDVEKRSEKSNAELSPSPREETIVAVQRLDSTEVTEAAQPAQADAKVDQALLAKEACACRRTVDPCDPRRTLPSDAVFPKAPGHFVFGRCPPCIARSFEAVNQSAADAAGEDLSLIVVSRNYESYLCGHAIYAWHLCHYLMAHTRCTVYHIMHCANDGPCHGVQICPPIVHERYHVRYVQAFSHGKLPDAFKSCLAADTLAACVAEARSDRSSTPVAALFVSPFLFGADTFNVAKEMAVPVYSSMRGTDMLILKKKEFTDSPTGSRYLKALQEMDGVYVQGEWMLGEAEKLKVPAIGCFQTIVDLPSSTDLGETWRSWCAAVDFDPADRRPIICYVGRLSPEKGAIMIAKTFRHLLAHRSDMRTLIAGSGPCEDEVRQLVPEIKGRSVITKLSIFEVLAVAKHCGQMPGSLLVTAPGLEGDFQEALGSTYIYFSCHGTPVLFPVDNNTGGCLETVSPQNTEWCREVGMPVEQWPVSIGAYLDGEYADRRIQEANVAYGRRFLAELQVAPRIAEWACAARSAAQKL